MKRIDFKKLLKEIDHYLKCLHVDESVVFKTYKRDRYILIQAAENDIFEVTEHGFNNQTYQGNYVEVKKLLHTSVQVEFPRSNMAWMQHYKNTVKNKPDEEQLK
ncbi:hypothetical protein [Moritella dasanensis]|uniref:hypothetical protein n=1 Tax=Moritella dasanensis TaxID=428031 RepID=UPI0002E822E4|nr:hypothetical protein [Moritella dasanensis]